MSEKQTSLIAERDEAALAGAHQPPTVHDAISIVSEPQTPIQPAAYEATPLSIIRGAIERGVPPDVLEKLIALQERMERNAAEKAYSAAMHACQQAMPRVIKDSTNPSTKSRYASLENIKDACKPIWLANGFALSYGEADCPLPNYKRTTCDVRHDGGACHTYHLDLPNDGIGAKGNPIGQMNPVQAAISTTSYGERRLCCMIFDITVAGEDRDGNLPADMITQEQIATLNEWIESTETNLGRFLAWLGVDSLDKIPVGEFSKAIEMLKRKGAKR